MIGTHYVVGLLMINWPTDGSVATINIQDTSSAVLMCIELHDNCEQLGSNGTPNDATLSK